MNNTKQREGVEHLLLPRIKCIADFWDNPFDVGQIIQFEDYSDYHDFYTGKVIGQDWSTGFIELKRPYKIHSAGGSIVWNLRGFTAYPHLFKKLAWYEDREESEMPMYIKGIHLVSGKKIVIKPVWERFDRQYFGWDEKAKVGMYSSLSEPATEGEYVAQPNNNT